MGNIKNYRYKSLVRLVGFRHPVAEISDLTGFSKSVVSVVNADKREATDKFIRILSDKIEEKFGFTEKEQKEHLIEMFPDTLVLEPTEPYHNSRANSKLKITPFLVPFLPVPAQAGYIRAYDQIQYTDTLEKYSLPPGVDYRGAEWMYFEIAGDSMEKTFMAGDVILCSMVPLVDWFDIRNFYVYVIITDSEVLVKRIYRKGDDTWVLISDNEDRYPQQLIKVSEVKQLWLYRKTWHTSAKPPKEFEIKI